MKVWKQMLISVALVAIAFVGWAMLYPGAKPVLARYGIDWFSGPPVQTAGAPGGGAPRQGGQAPGGQGQRGGFSRDALVITQPATFGTVNDRLTAIGTGQAVRTVSVRALVSGQIAEIPVVSGAHVAAGDVIIRLDAAEEELAVERARLAVDDAQRKFDRTASLLAQHAVSSVEADQAKSDLTTARVALRAAELDLSRRTVTAPIAGSLGILSVNAGDYVTSQSDVTTIDDRSQILVEFYVPERFAARMIVGKTISATAVARPGEVFEGEITAVDNRVDEASRTLRVQARIANDEDLLRAGMSFEVTLHFGGETWPSVDPLAIQWDSTGPYVWRVVDDKAERLGIAIIQRNADRVLVKADLKEGDAIITEGVQSVRNGAAVRIAGEPPQGGDGAPPAGAGGQKPQGGNGQRPQGTNGQRPQGTDGKPANGAPRPGAGS